MSAGTTSPTGSTVGPTSEETSTSSGTGSKWLQGRVPLTTPTTKSEAESFLASVKKSQRAKLSVTELSKLRTKAEASITHKFDLMEKTNLKDLDSLTEVYRIAIRIEEFSQELKSFDMGGVFSVPSKFSYHESDNTFHPSDDAEKINLFHYFRTLDVETVLKFSD